MTARIAKVAYPSIMMTERSSLPINKLYFYRQKNNDLCCRIYARIDFRLKRAISMKKSSSLLKATANLGSRD